MAVEKSTMQDMTVGSPVHHILKFFFPLLFGMLFQQFYSLVDTAIVGRFLGPDALAAVGATGSVNFLVLGFCMGVCNGFAILFVDFLNLFCLCDDFLHTFIEITFVLAIL